MTPRDRRTAAGTAIVVGIGEPWRGDDGIGPRVVRALRGRTARPIRLVEHAQPTELVDLRDGAEVAVVVDASLSGGLAGTVVVVEGDGLGRLAAERTTSSHGLGVREAVELARALGRLPRRLVLVLVEARALEHGEGLTPELEAAVEAAAREVLRALEVPAPSAPGGA